MVNIALLGGHRSGSNDTLLIKIDNSWNPLPRKESQSDRDFLHHRPTLKSTPGSTYSSSCSSVSSSTSAEHLLNVLDYHRVATKWNRHCLMALIE